MTREKITDENIWITGGGSGIGRSLAQHLADMGNYVIITGRNQQNLETTRAHDPKRIVTLPLDVTGEDVVTVAREKMKEITDSLDRVILGAGTCEYVDDVSELDIDLFRRVFEVNFFGMVNSVSIATPFLTNAQRRGHIITLGSLSTVVPFPRAEAYGASKAAVNYFFDSLRMDVSGRNIDVTVVSPGFVDTPLTRRNDFQMPFLMEADEAARIIIKGMTRREKQIIFPGKLKWLLYLGKMFPGIWFNMMVNRMAQKQGALAK